MKLASVDKSKKEFGDVLYKECFLVGDIGWKDGMFQIANLFYDSKTVPER